jgi:hypothetical protein
VSKPVKPECCRCSFLGAEHAPIQGKAPNGPSRRWILDSAASPSRGIPVVTTTLNAGDIPGDAKARKTMARTCYLIEPELLCTP